MAKRLKKCLDGMGNVYSIQDIIDACNARTMQWWQEEDLVTITQVSIFPQKRILSCLMTFGRWDEARARILHERVCAFGRAEGCEYFATEGRKGWSKTLGALGWKTSGITMRYKL